MNGVIEGIWLTEYEHNDDAKLYHYDHADLWYKEEALAFPSMNIPESQIPEKGSDSERISMW